MTKKANCLHCGAEFEVRRAGHIFCRSACRYAHQGDGDQGPLATVEELEQLFDESRDPQEPVRLDDWHPNKGNLAWVELDLYETLADRRRWYQNARAAEEP
jgi:hypothetical protein